MPNEQAPKQIRPAVWLIIKGISLVITGYLAAAGMTFVCLVSGYLNRSASDSGVQFGPYVPDAVYAALFVIMLIWLVFAGRFAWRNRTWPGLSLSVIAFIVFAVNAYGVLRYAYPVCNPF